MKFCVNNNYNEENVVVKYNNKRGYYDVKDLDIEGIKKTDKDLFIYSTIIEDGQNKLVQKELKTSIKDFDKRFKDFNKVYVYEIHI